jgi:cell division protein FtsB
MRVVAFALMLLLGGLQYPLWMGKGGWSQVWRLEQQVQGKRSVNAKLAQRNTALTEEVKDLEDGLDAVEERARAELGMIKRGELFVQVVPDSGGETTLAISAAPKFSAPLPGTLPAPAGAQ